MLPKMPPSKETPFGKHTKIVYNGNLYVIYTRGRPVAFCFTEKEALDYADRYDSYEEDGDAEEYVPKEDEACSKE